MTISSPQKLHSLRLPMKLKRGKLYLKMTTLSWILKKFQLMFLRILNHAYRELRGISSVISALKKP